MANSLSSSMYMRWLISSCNLVSLNPPVHFLSIWLNVIIAITNSNDDSASPWNIPLWIYTFAKIFLPAFSFTLQFFMVSSMNLMTSSDILHILRNFIIQLCRTISIAFLELIHAIAKFLRLVLLSLMICWSMFSRSPVPLVP